ncbi:hypothetical protein HN51_011237, partial [Arachis hypogaea]
MEDDGVLVGGFCYYNMGCTCSKNSTIEDCRKWITNKLSYCTGTSDLNISHLNSS